MLYSFAMNSNLNTFFIESDSSTVVGWISQVKYIPWKLLNILNLINFLVVETIFLGV